MAKFYYRGTKTALDSISSLLSGDRGVVITDSGFTKFYYHNGTSWIDSNKFLNIIENKTSDYPIVVNDLYKSFRVNSSDDITLTLPSVSSTEDGARIYFYKLGTGTLTIQASDSDIIADGTAGGTIYNPQADQTYATLSLEYIDSATKWVIIGAHGLWITT